MDEDYVLLAGCIIVDDYGRMLLLHRSTDDYSHWELPGGKVEADELPEATAIREIREELGVDVRLTKALGSEVFEDNDRVFKFYWFQAVIARGTVRVMEEALFDDYDYIELEDLPSIALSANMLVLEQKLLSGAVVLGS
ncbi:MAG: hydrolase [Candidatus Saccharibacteria bacterium]|nr:hydrolase [Candidatus Saccharibacteria bacterium]